MMMSDAIAAKRPAGSARSRRNTALAVAATALFGVADAPARTFEDRYGRVIDADLVAHKGAELDTVRIRKGGDEMEVKIALFSDKDQEFIRAWMKETPPTLDYSFRVTAERKLSGDDGPRRLTYDVSVTTLTRQPVRDLRVEYRAYKLDRTNFGGFPRGFGSGRFGGFGRGESAAEDKEDFVSDAMDVEGPLEFNHSHEFTTKELTLDRGYGDGKDDEAMGVIVRIFGPDGTKVYEHRDPRVAKVEWPDDEPSTGPAPDPAEDPTEAFRRRFQGFDR